LRPWPGDGSQVIRPLVPSGHLTDQDGKPSNSEADALVFKLTASR
jgi:hypothetical protein